MRLIIQVYNRKVEIMQVHNEVLDFIVKIKYVFYFILYFLPCPTNVLIK